VEVDVGDVDAVDLRLGCGQPLKGGQCSPFDRVVERRRFEQRLDGRPVARRLISIDRDGDTSAVQPVLTDGFRPQVVATQIELAQLGA
jgi:hypothetical protein